MKINKLLTPFLCLVLTGVINADGVQEQSTEKKEAPQIRRSLIRKDLLERVSQPLKLPERNIFKPDRRRTASGIQPDTGPVVPPSEEVASPTEEAGEIITGWTGQLRYIGYIGSRQRTVALILFNGQALAVEEGEKISDKVKVVKISPKEVEFEGPDSMPIKAVLEGEK